MWAKYKCMICNEEMSYFKSTPTKRCVTFIGKVQGYCKVELIEMDSNTIKEIKHQHKKPFEHGKINATAN